MTEETSRSGPEPAEPTPADDSETPGLKALLPSGDRQSAAPSPTADEGVSDPSGPHCPPPSADASPAPITEAVQPAQSVQDAPEAEAGAPGSAFVEPAPAQAGSGAGESEGLAIAAADLDAEAEPPLSHASPDREPAPGTPAETQDLREEQSPADAILASMPEPLPSEPSASGQPSEASRADDDQAAREPGPQAAPSPTSTAGTGAHGTASAALPDDAAADRGQTEAVDPIWQTQDPAAQAGPGSSFVDAAAGAATGLAAADAAPSQASAPAELPPAPVPEDLIWSRPEAERTDEAHAQAPAEPEPVEAAAAPGEDTAVAIWQGPADETERPREPAPVAAATLPAPSPVAAAMPGPAAGIAIPAPARPRRFPVLHYAWRAVRLAAIAFVGYAALVAVLAVLYRWVDPPTSNLMIAQRLLGTQIEQKWVPLNRISPHLVQAVILSEDAGFCRHHGVDWAAVEEAIESAYEGSARGGSTITMQLVKNLFLWSSRSYIRKAIEIPLAYFVELLWPKQRVLEIYLNIVEWGDGVFGAEAAARHHFGRPASQLSAQEAALLAASLPNPIERQAGRPGPLTRRLAANLMTRMKSVRTPMNCVQTSRGLW